MTLEEKIEMNLYRKILILAINEIVRRGLIFLKFSGNNMPDDNEFGQIFADLAGVPSLIFWENIGYGELRVSVWWNFDHSKHSQANSYGDVIEQNLAPSPVANKIHYKEIVGATVTGWLERKDGPYIQGIGDQGFDEIYLRQSDRGQLQALRTPVPKGYRAEGKFYR